MNYFIYISNDITVGLILCLIHIIKIEIPELSYYLFKRALLVRTSSSSTFLQKATVVTILQCYNMTMLYKFATSKDYNFD